jgi:hypothetical protein
MDRSRGPGRAAEALVINVAGKTVMVVMRREAPARTLFHATTQCRECNAECTIAPASVDRLRAEPLIVVLCLECAHKANVFKAEIVEPVSAREVAETYRAICRRCGRTGQAHIAGDGCDRFER